jgi:hypothetical protein
MSCKIGSKIVLSGAPEIVCNIGDTILCSRRAPANKRKLGQFQAPKIDGGNPITSKMVA